LKSYSILICVGFLLCAAGCVGTVSPTVRQSDSVSYSGNYKDSGIIEKAAAGWVVRPELASEYRSYFKIYAGILVGKDVTRGVIKMNDGNYLFDNEAMEQYILLRDLYQSGFPTKP
jgi:hypothetical protein